MGDAYVQLRNEIRQLRMHCKAGKISKEDAAYELKLIAGERERFLTKWLQSECSASLMEASRSLLIFKKPSSTMKTNP